MEEMLLTSPNATSHSVRENKGGPYYWLGLISYRHPIQLTKILFFRDHSESLLS